LAIVSVPLGSMCDAWRNAMKKAPKVQNKKALTLSTETIRNLGDSELTEVAGGSRTFTRTSIDFACKN